MQFRIVADARDKAIDELEEKVRERTKELEASKDYGDNIIKSMADTLIVVNPDTTIQTVNQATLDLLGYAENELIGNSVGVIFAKEDISPLFKKSGLAALIQQEAIRNVEETYLTKDGKEIPVLFSGSVMCDDNGEVQGIICVAQDITERVQAEENLRRYVARLKILREIDGAILSARVPEEIAQAAVSRIAQLVPCMRASLLSFDIETEQVTAIAVRVDGKTMLGRGTRDSMQGAWDIVNTLQRGEVYMMDDLSARNQPSSVFQSLQAEGVRAFLVVPLIAQGNLIGAFNLGADSPGAFNKEHIGIAQEIANSLAVAIQNTRLHEQVQSHTAELEVRNEQLQREIYERVHAAEQLRYQKALLECQSEAAIDGILFVDSNRKWVSFNRRFIEMWGIPEHMVETCSSQGALRSVLDKLVDAQQFLEKIEYLYKYNDEESRDEIALKDGRTFDSYSAPVRSNYGRIWYYRDITERKHLEREILTISEKEQQRIGQDLHDDLGQHLAGIACLSQVLAHNLAKTPLAEAAEQAEQITKLITQALGKTRHLARGLIPVDLAGNGLLPALQILADNVENQFGISCPLTWETSLQIDDSVTATHLYRIAQEAVHNAAKHGQAKHVMIDLSAVNGKVTLRVKDDGVGFQQSLAVEKGIGLRIMRYRASIIGGRLEIQRGDDGGTIVTCSIQRPPDALKAAPTLES